MVTKVLFVIFVFCLAGQRWFELKKSERHRRRLLQIGGREHGASHFPLMILIHICWLIAMPAEVFLFDRKAIPSLAVCAMVVFAFGQALRIMAMLELRHRWTARIITIPDLPPITSGIFRCLRHPNYLGVVLELASAPLIHSAFFTSIIFSLLNLGLLKVRITEEEKALNIDNQYYQAFLLKRRIGH